MKIKVNDNVKILAGKDKGKTGIVVKTLKKEDKVVVEGINVHKRHQKPNNANENGGIIEFSAPIHVSNVKKIEKEEKKAVDKETKKVEKKETTAKKATKKTLEKDEK